jgi:hypothetical protein
VPPASRPAGLALASNLHGAEFLKISPRPLSSDAFSGWCGRCGLPAAHATRTESAPGTRRGRHNSEVHDSEVVSVYKDGERVRCCKLDRDPSAGGGAVFLKKVIPQTALDLLSAEGRAAADYLRILTAPLETSISSFVHKRGVNMRFLGLLRRVAAAEGAKAGVAADVIKAAQADLLVRREDAVLLARPDGAPLQEEMVVRCIKVRFGSIQRGIKTVTEEPFLLAALAFLQQIYGAPAQGDYWSGPLADDIGFKFGVRVEPADLEALRARVSGRLRCPSHHRHRPMSRVRAYGSCSRRRRRKSAASPRPSSSTEWPLCVECSTPCRLPGTMGRRARALCYAIPPRAR